MDNNIIKLWKFLKCVILPCELSSVKIQIAHNARSIELKYESTKGCTYEWDSNVSKCILGILPKLEIKLGHKSQSTLSP